MTELLARLTSCTLGRLRGDPEYLSRWERRHIQRQAALAYYERIGANRPSAVIAAETKLACKDAPRISMADLPHVTLG